MDNEDHDGDTNNVTSNSTLYINQFRHHLSQLQANTDNSEPDYIPPTGYWTPSEKDIFFHALSVYSTLRPDLIAARLAHKSVVDVCAYIDLLASASADNRNPVSRRDLDISMEVSEDWIRLEEVEGAHLSMREQSWDAAAQRRAKQELIDQEETGLFGDNTDQRHSLRDGFDSWKSTLEASWAQLDPLKCMTPKQLAVLDGILFRDDDSQDSVMVEPAVVTVSLEQSESVQMVLPTLPETPTANVVTGQTSDLVNDPILISESVAEQSPTVTALSSVPPPLPSQTTSTSPLNHEPTPDLSQLSPKSRRRLQKRLYMRRKRAETNGGEVVNNIAKLRPGRKQKPMPPKKPEKKPAEEKLSNEDIQAGEEICDDEEARPQSSEKDYATVTQERDVSCGPSTQTLGNTSCAVEVDTRVPETDFHHRRASGKTEAAKFKQLLEERGVDATFLHQIDLGLFYMSPLGRLMKMYKSAYEPTDHSTVNTTISADTFRLLHAIIVEFTTNVIHRSIVYREQDYLLKANKKVWKDDNKHDILPQHIKYALHMLGMPHLLNLKRFIEGDENTVNAGKEGNKPTSDSELSSTEAAEKDEEEDDKEVDTNGDLEGSIELDEQADSMALLHREMNPAIVRLSSELDSSSEDIFMASDTEEELLMEELEEEADLDEQDTLLGRRYEEDLWYTGFT